MRERHTDMFPRFFGMLPSEKIRAGMRGKTKMNEEEITNARYSNDIIEVLNDDDGNVVPQGWLPAQIVFLAAGPDGIDWIEICLLDKNNRPSPWHISMPNKDFATKLRNKQTP